MPSSELSLRIVDQRALSSSQKNEDTVIKDGDWKEGHEKAHAKDSAMLKDYDNEIDTMLVFAGLFSAILTAFIVEVYKDLRVDSSDTSAAILERILAVLEGRSPPPIELPPRADPSTTSLAVLALWFTALILALLAALFGISIKQWLHVYSQWTDVARNGREEGLLLRGFYQASLTAWHVRDIFTTLGVVLQASLVFFVIGLVCYLWPLSFIVSGIVTAAVVVMIVLSLISVLLPLRAKTCPYKSPLAHILLNVRRISSARDWTDRDLKIAQSDLHYTRSNFDKALVRASLLLDIPLSSLVSAIAYSYHIGYGDASNSESSLQGKLFSQGRIRQLQPESARLLSNIVAEPIASGFHPYAAVASVSAGHQTIQLGSVPHQEALRLWHLVFSSLPSPQVSMLQILSYLIRDDHLVVPHALGLGVEKEEVELLVDVLFPHCVQLHEKEQMPSAQLSAIACAVDAWATSTSCPQEYAASLSLRAMQMAGNVIRDIPAPSNGLSPVTPFLNVVTALESRLGIVRNYPADPEFDRLRAGCVKLLQELKHRHRSFVCYRRSGYNIPENTRAWPLELAFIEAGSKLFVGTDEDSAWILDLSHSQSENAVPPQVPSDVVLRAPLCSRDGSLVVWGSRQGQLFAYNSSHTPQSAGAGSVAAMGEMKRFDVGYGKQSRPLALSHDGEYALATTDMNFASLCRVATDDSFCIITTFEGHTKKAVQAAFAPHEDGLHDRVATTSFDNTMMVWDVETGDRLLACRELGTNINAVAWSHDGKLLAVSANNTVHVFKMPTGERHTTLQGHTKLVTGVAFSPDGKYIASCGNDRRLRIWTVGDVAKDSEQKSACVAILAGPEDDANRVAFSPNGLKVACSADDSVWIWDINPDCEPRAVVEDDKAKTKDP